MKKNRAFMITLCVCVLLAGCSNRHHNSISTNAIAHPAETTSISLIETAAGTATSEWEKGRLTGEIKDPLCAPGGDNNTQESTASTTTKPKGAAVKTKAVKFSTEFIDDYTHKYYYQSLTNDQKKYYRYCFDQKRYLTVAPEPKMSDKDKRIALIAFNRDNPHLVLYPTRYSIDNGLTSMTAKKRNKVLKAAKAIADKACKYERTFDKLKVIHDSLLDHITYESYKEMISAFLEGKADCSGYADAFCMVCQLAGIECIVVWGTANNGAGVNEHAWNMVRIGDDWYNVDVCWDDVKHDRYTYFLRSDNAFCKNHTAETLICCPNASKKYPVDHLGNETI